jgi:hypothetical protein
LTRSSEEVEERRKRIAEGIALIAAGNSERWAARQVDIPKTTLRRAYERIRSAKTDQEKETLDNELIAHAILNANLAGQELTRRLSDPVELKKAQIRDLTQVYGVNVDKVAHKRRWARPEDQGTEDLLHKLTESMTRIRRVTVEINDPADEAVDVTPVNHERQDTQQD